MPALEAKGEYRPPKIVMVINFDAIAASCLNHSAVPHAGGLRCCPACAKPADCLHRNRADIAVSWRRGLQRW
jgi:hypothetical protein